MFFFVLVVLVVSVDWFVVVVVAVQVMVFGCYLHFLLTWLLLL